MSAGFGSDKNMRLESLEKSDKGDFVEGMSVWEHSTRCIV